MQFRKGDLSGVLVNGRVVIGNQVIYKRYIAVPIPSLLKPSQSKTMGVKAGDDIGQSITVYIVYRHHTASYSDTPVSVTGESLRMKLPITRILSRGRLLQPAIRINNVNP